MNIEKSKQIEALCKELSDLMDSPEDCMVMLAWFIDKFNDDYNELAAMHQRKSAGRCYARIAKALERAWIIAHTA